MKECEYEQALERLRQHYEDASVLHATIMNSANEVWTNCVDDKEFFNRLADATTVAEKLARITRDNIKEIMDAFILEFKDKIKDRDDIYFTRLEQLSRHIVNRKVKCDESINEG